jgi:hypothetical protein
MCAFIRTIKTSEETELNNFKQGCGSGSGLDPDSETCVDPDPGARKLRNFSGKNALLIIFKKHFTSKKV